LGHAGSQGLGHGANWLQPGDLAPAKNMHGKGEAQHGSRRDCIGLDFSIAMVCPAKP
jgi:hypothetical protein